MSVFACLVSTLAPACVYLSSADQRLTQAPLHPVWKGIGFALGAAGVFLWAQTVSTPAAIFASASVWATAYVVLPYMSWVKAPSTDES